MDASDMHLENALGEYNDKVNELEPLGESEELLEAYVNRGCILYMMEYRTSAMEDLATAADLIDSLETSGLVVDSGTFVKTYTSMASILFDQDSDPVEAYDKAATRLSNLGDPPRHFDHRSIVRMCIEACENLIDSEYPEDVEPFLDKGMSMVDGRADSWSMNRMLELLNLEGEAWNDRNDPQAAIESYAKAVDTGTELLERGALEDTEELIMSFVSKAECEQGLDLTDMYLADMNAAITLLEQLDQFHRLDDPEVLVSLHHDVASVLMKAGRIEEAEKHLVKAMKVGIRGAEDYINMHTPGER